MLYEEAVLHFDEGRKWRERYMVVRANYCLECHDSLEVNGLSRTQSAHVTARQHGLKRFFF